MIASKFSPKIRMTRRFLWRTGVDAIYHRLLGPLRYKIAARRLVREMRNVRPALNASNVSTERSALTVVLRIGEDPVRTSFCLEHLFRASGRRIDLRVVRRKGDPELPTTDWHADWKRILEVVPSYTQVVASHLASCVLLLSDTIAPDAETLDAACNEIEHINVDVIVPRLRLPHGGLLSAGGMLVDGNAVAYGRWTPSGRPDTMFRREVDYGSTHLLLLSAAAFASIASELDATTGDDDSGGIRISRDLRELGCRVWYEPSVTGLFLGSEVSSTAADPASKPAAVILRARDRSPVRGRVLMIEDRVPHVWLGAGFPRSRSIAAELLELGYFVTFYPTHDVADWWEQIRNTLDSRVEVMRGLSLDDLEGFLRARSGYYDACIVSRPHNMRAIKPLLTRLRREGERMRLIYDAEALFTVRNIAERRLRGEFVSAEEEAQTVMEEVALSDDCDAILTVSRPEAARFKVHPRTSSAPAVHVLSHVVSPNLTPAAFEQRSGFLFVGPILDLRWPNADALRWFIDNVLPLVKNHLHSAATLRVVGLNQTTWRPDETPGVECLGVTENLADAHNSARVFVAPTRFAAGIPLKIFGAAAAGVPVVATSLLAAQLGWTGGKELCIADTAEEFAHTCAQLHSDEALWTRVREAAFTRVSDECSQERFRKTLEAALRRE